MVLFSQEKIEKVVNVSQLKKPAAVPANKADLLELQDRWPFFSSRAPVTEYLYMNIVLPATLPAFTYGSIE